MTAIPLELATCQCHSCLHLVRAELAEEITEPTYGCGCGQCNYWEHALRDAKTPVDAREARESLMFHLRTCSK
jgi:hypothetical protein